MKDHVCGTNQSLPQSAVLLNKQFQQPMSYKDHSPSKQGKHKQKGIITNKRDNTKENVINKVQNTKVTREINKGKRMVQTKIIIIKKITPVGIW